MNAKSQSTPRVFELQPAAQDRPRLTPTLRGYAVEHDDAEVVPDPELGVALRLDPGEDVTVCFPALHQPRASMAVSLWVRWGEPVASVDPSALGGTELPQGWCAIQFGGDDVLARLGTKVFALERVGEASNAWRHVALVWLPDHAGVQIYVDGELRAEAESFPDVAEGTPEPALAVATDPQETRPLFVGPLRLHRGEPTRKELRAQAAADRLAHPALNDRHPLAIRLADHLDEPTLYITDDDVGGRPLNVVLDNRSRFPVDLPYADPATPNDPRSWKNALELRFRPGCLEPTAGHWVEANVPGWSVHVEAHRPNHDERDEADDAPGQGGLPRHGEVSVYLTRTQPMTLAPGQGAALALHHVRGSNAVGAHGTRAALRYRHPHHPEQDLLCSRICLARVVGQRGRRRSPLRVGVERGGCVINDGQTPNELVLYVANTSQNQTLALPSPVHGVGAAFMLSFDSGGHDAAWALGTANQLLGADLSAFKVGVREKQPEDGPPGPPPTERDEVVQWTVDVETQGENPVWILSPTRDETLNPGERIRIQVKTLLTDLPAGLTRGYVRLENIPGYWDDDRSFELRKTRARMESRNHDVLRTFGDIVAEGSVTDSIGELSPAGTIVLWSTTYGGPVPHGWVICDGEDGRPNLQHMFVSTSVAESGPGLYKRKRWIFPIMRIDGRTLAEPRKYVSPSA